MQNKKYQLLFAVIFLQILFFVIWSWTEVAKLSNPKSQIILVKTLPVDPRNLISGNYLTLRYDFSDLWQFENNAKYANNGEKQFYVVLKQEGKYYVKDYLINAKPLIRKDQVVLKVKYVDNYSQLEFGIEKFFINENMAQPKMNDKIEVELVIDEDGSAKIKRVMVNGANL